MLRADSASRGRTAALALTLVSGVLACLALLTAPGTVQGSDGTFTEAFVNSGVMQWTPILVPLSALAGALAGGRAAWGVLGILATQLLTAYVYMTRDAGSMGNLQNFAYVYAVVLSLLCLLAVGVGALIRRTWVRPAGRRAARGRDRAHDPAEGRAHDPAQGRAQDTSEPSTR